jgi:hypothetical protein
MQPLGPQAELALAPGFSEKKTLMKYFSLDSKPSSAGPNAGNGFLQFTELLA